MSTMTFVGIKSPTVKSESCTVAMSEAETKENCKREAIPERFGGKRKGTSELKDRSIYASRSNIQVAQSSYSHPVLRADCASIMCPQFRGGELLALVVK